MANTVFLRAGKKTQVIVSAGLFETYQVVFPRQDMPVKIEWERNSTLPPWHTWGTHDPRGPFYATVAGLYCNFWLTSSRDMRVSVYAPPYPV